jgi:hypothetical protein
MMPSPLSTIATDILASASRHQHMLQAAANDDDLESLLEEIAQNHIGIVDRIVAVRKIRERRGSWAPGDHDDFDSLMVAAEMAKPTAVEKRFLLSMEDVYRRCDTGLPDVLKGTWNPIADAYVALLQLGGHGYETPIASVYRHVLDKAHGLIIEAKVAADLQVAA